MTCILVHGGAGPRYSDDQPERAQAGCLAAARAGYAVLQQGGSALDAVEQAARVLEDDPLFNAGTGSVLNADGEVEMDASIMEGETLRAGAVAAVRVTKNPVTLARAVMEHSPHVLLVGAGAELFGRKHGIEQVDPASLITERARRRWEARRRAQHGTIGAVARDAKGHLAAATSTGGTSGKLPGRVGDSPLIGCGTYADDRLGAASATGIGEHIIRVTLTRLTVDLVGRGVAPAEAVKQGIAELVRIGGDGGVILVSPAGELALSFSSERMPWASVCDGVEATGFSK